MDNVLITGGTGFVGYWLRACRPKDVNVYNIGRARYESMDWIRGKWSAIIHAAPTEPTAIIECARRNKCRVLYTSSGIVYHPENNTPYRIGKIEGEKELLDSGIDVVIARLFTFYGDHLDDKKAISTFYAAAAENKTLIITGDGNTTRSYMHGSLMAFWLWKLLASGDTGEAYDVGWPTPITMLQLAKNIVEETGSKSQIVILGDKDPMPYYMPEDLDKTRKIVYNENK